MSNFSKSALSDLLPMIMKYSTVSGNDLCGRESKDVRHISPNERYQHTLDQLQLDWTWIWLDCFGGRQTPTYTIYTTPVNKENMLTILFNIEKYVIANR